jgi:hypothetical protein
MWNKNTLPRLRKVYQEISFATVEQLWQKNIAPLGVYIHNPFCPKVCRFCAYKGRVPRPGEMERYYERYLPGQINFYRTILAQNPVQSWFFGGGTPSLMTAGTLRYILSLLPGIKQCGEKTFEIHPAQFDPELLDILHEYNFQNIIIGVQSFNQAVLRKTNRLSAAKSVIRNIIRKAQEYKINVWTDIVGFFNAEPAELDILIEDLKTIAELSPDEISVCLNYYCREKYLPKTIKPLTTLLAGADFPYFLSGQSGHPVEISAENVKTILVKARVLRLLRKDNYQSVINNACFLQALYDQSTTMKTPSILGMGSYKNQIHSTMSYVSTASDKYHYTEINENFEPRFFITKRVPCGSSPMNSVKNMGLPVGLGLERIKNAKN